MCVYRCMQIIFFIINVFLIHLLRSFTLLYILNIEKKTLINKIAIANNISTNKIVDDAERHIEEAKIITNILI